jgi:hypothetical protein
MSRPYSCSRSLAVLVVATLAMVGCSTRAPVPTGQVAPPAAGRSEQPADLPRGATSDTGGGGGRSGPTPQPRPYNRVITPGARTQRGLFAVHQIGERLYFEIPAQELNKDQLIVTRAAAGTAGNNNRVVHWERNGNRIFLRQVNYTVIADTTLPIYRSVAAQMLGPIIAAFNVEAYGPDSAAVIDATKLYTTNITEFAGVPQVAADRSFIEMVAAYPTNIEVEATQTGTAPPPPATGGRGGGGGGGAAARPVTTTVIMHWSMLRLPEQPMMPRLHDARVGFNSTTRVDYGRDEHRAVTRRYINRFRLEKRDPGAPVSEPVKPIVFWIDPATPRWLVPWVRAGIESWKPAYEEAGFRNAIIAREAPSVADDPNWSIHDARNSMVYWRASETQNATGGQTVDPRTGEIIKAEVNMFHNVQNLLRNWYFTQVSPLDIRAQKLPLPDSLMGRLVQYVVAHEVGHAIGFPHNMKSSSMYPVDSLRKRGFLERMGGHVATLMDYSRFNYVAQPEDSIPPHLLIPGVGPYDKFAVRWGHTPIPGAKTPDDERPTLDRWARMQDTVPWFRYETADATNDPGDLTEAVGDENAVKASALALKNLERVAGSLLRVAERPGEDYSLLRELYGNVVSQWGRYMSHVAAVVAGAESQEKLGTGQRFFPLSQARQQEAVRFLTANAFQTPAYFTQPEILRRIEPEGVLGRIRQAQGNVLNSLFSESRLNRLIEYEALAAKSGDAYTVGELLRDLRAGVWGELSASNVKIDVYRRNLQRAYIEAIERQIAPPDTPDTPPPAAPGGPPVPPRFTSDARPLLRGHLVELDRAVQNALSRTRDEVTRLHLQDVRLQIENILNPGT